MVINALEAEIKYCQSLSHHKDKEASLKLYFDYKEFWENWDYNLEQKSPVSVTEWL